MTEPVAHVVYEFGMFRLDPRRRQLVSSNDGSPIPLGPKVFEALLYLVERRGELLDKATLMKAIWPNLVVEENNLNQSISALRRVLGESPGEHKYIVTEPGRGYRFVADVRTVSISPPPRGAPSETPKTAPFSISPASTEARGSIAVLPFANLTGDPGKEYFGDGMAEELIHQLSRVPGLRVTARTSSFAYKGKNADVRQIARDLGVETVLEGSVRGVGERIRVVAQLANASSGFHVWSHSWDRQFEDLFKLQDELAGAIVRALDVGTASPTGLQMPHAPPSADIEAYHLYLQASALLYRQNREDFPRIIAMLEDAVGRDPRFVRAFARIAMFHQVSVLLGFSGVASLADAERNALHALALDPQVWEAESVLAQVNAQHGNWLKAARYYESVIAADSGEASTRGGYGLFLGNAGHIRKAIAEVQEALRLAPAVPSFASHLSGWYSILGSDADALRFANLAIALGFPMKTMPLPLVLANAAQRAGDPANAARYTIQLLSPKVLAAGGVEVVELVCAALTDPARRKPAVEALRSFRDKASEPDAMGSSLMTVLAINWLTMLGSLDAAYEVASQGLDQLERSGTIGANWGGLWVPEMRPFRQDPRFQAFVTRLGLMDYWKQYGPPDDCELSGGKLTCR